MISTDAILEIFLADRCPENRDRVIAQYSYLQTRAARRFLRVGLDRADLEQIAAIGLIKACDRYNHAEQTPFEAFAWLLIVGELMHFVRDHERVIRAPRRIRSLDRKVRAASEHLTVQLRRMPRRSEIAAFAGVSEREVDEVSVYHARALSQSLDDLKPHQTPCTSSEQKELEDAIAIDAALRRLSAVERKIILAMYARGFSQTEIAEHLGYSRRHVCRLHRAALEKLHNIIVSQS